MEIIFFPLTVILLITAIVIKGHIREYLALAGNGIFAISAVCCIFDITNRFFAGDYGGIEDVYPTIKWYYLAMLILVIVMNIVFALLKRKNTE